MSHFSADITKISVKEAAKCMIVERLIYARLQKIENRQSLFFYPFYESGSYI
ncbi:MAG: hypothetical protein V4489_04255 [Chlamydiota bacterium]